MGITLDDALLDEPVSEGVNEFGGEDFSAPTDEKVDRGDNFNEDSSDEELEAETDTDNSGADDTGDDDSDADAVDDEVDDGSDDDKSDDDADADEPEDDDKKPIPDKIPRERLNKEIEKRKAVEQRLRELEASAKTEQKPDNVDKPAAPEFKIDPERFQKMQDAMVDGETADAMGIFQELLTGAVTSATELVRTQTKEELLGEINTREANKELSKVSSELMESYPELDSSSDTYDDTLVEEVVELRDIYLDRGKSPGEALRRAVKLVADENSLEDRKAVAAKEPEPKPKPKTKRDIAGKVKLAEKERGKLRGDSAVNKDVLDISKLTDAQFDRLSPEAKAKARGDIL